MRLPGSSDADATPDVAAAMAAAWNRCSDATVVVTDFWPCCQVLADAGVVQGDEASLGVAALGPYKIAYTAYTEAADDFISTLFPAAMVGIAAGHPESGAATGFFSGLCRCFVGLLRRGVVFGRCEPDVTRWLVLAEVRSENAQGLFPTRDDLLDRVRGADGQLLPPSSVSDAVDWLSRSHGFSEGGAHPLIEERRDGSLRCLV